MATLTGELISETYDSLLKVTDNNTITGVKKRITDGFGNEIPLQLSSTDIEIDGTLILSSLTDVEVATKFLILKADNSIAYRTAAEVLSDIGGASSSSISGTTGNIAKFTSTSAVGNSILEEIENAIHLTDGTSSYASFGIINPGIPGEPGVNNDAYIGSTINNDFIIRVNNTEALRIDTALRLKIANIQNATTDTDKFLVSDGGVVKYRTGAELLSDIGGASASGYVTLDTDQTITGQKSLTSLLIGTRANFTSSGSGDTLGINHSSGSGIALYMTKAGNGEALYINKSSGSGNAVTIVGTLNATTLVKNGGTSSQFLKADGSVDSTSYQPLLSDPVTGIGVTNYVPKFSALSLIGISQIYDNGTNVGINTSSPSFKLDVNGTLRVTGQLTLGSTITNGTYTYTLPSATGTLALTSDLGAYLPLSGGTLTGALFGTTASFASSIGLTSASSSSSLTSTTNGIEISVDGSTTSNKNTIFKVGSSETMRIDASGNLGLGVTPSAWLSNFKALQIGDISSIYSGFDGTYIANNTFVNTSSQAIYLKNQGASNYVQNGGQHLWYTAPSGTAGNAISFTQAMTLDASGRLGIGTTSPDGKIHGLASNFTNSQGFLFEGFRSTYSASSPVMYIKGLWENDTSRATDPILKVAAYNDSNGFNILHNGNVGIGTQTPNTKLFVTGASVPVNISSSDNTLCLGLGYQGTMHGYIGGISSALYAYSTNGGYVLLSSASVWIAASDAKRKRNFENYNLGLDAVLALEPKLYNMDFQKDGDDKQVGLVAQEVKECIPHAYEQSDDFIGLNYNAIIVTMVNAIKELKAEIDLLKNK